MMFKCEVCKKAKKYKEHEVKKRTFSAPTKNVKIAVRDETVKKRKKGREREKERESFENKIREKREEKGSFR